MMYAAGLPEGKTFLLKHRLMKKKCLDAASAEGDSATIRTCNKLSANQILEYNAATKTIKNKKSGFCLDDNGISIGSSGLTCPFGCTAVFYECNDSSARSQQWVYNPTYGVLQSVNKELCLTAWLADNTYLLWYCDQSGQSLGYYQQLDVTGKINA